MIDTGTIDNHVRLAIAAGLDPVTVVTMATLNGAEAFGLRDRGAIGPGRRADLVITQSLDDFRADVVVAGGRVVAEHGALTAPLDDQPIDLTAVGQSVAVDLDSLTLSIPAQGRLMRVIGVNPDTPSPNCDCCPPRLLVAKLSSTWIATSSRSLPSSAIAARATSALGSSRGWGSRQARSPALWPTTATTSRSLESVMPRC